jgi:phosphoribosyl-ATP pyrophosphohydrolase
MIIPCIDLMNGRAVQLVNGKTKALESDEDPVRLAEKFGMGGEIAVIDLDAAMGKGSNAEVIQKMLRVAPCRVGGGIRSYEAARDWLNAGAVKVILGTKAEPQILSQLPRARVMAAVDMRGGKVAVEGWQEVTQTDGINRMAELRDYVGGFLITNIDIEGTMQGFDITVAASLRNAAGNARLTMAGGITIAADIAALDTQNVDAQVGMALYTGKLDLADCIAAIMQTDRADGLWPTVVTDEMGQALGLVYSNADSLRTALAEQAGVYFSRRRGLWRKGETSGATQKLIRVDMDCDRDALRFTVAQSGTGFCHQGTANCFGAAAGLAALAERIQTAAQSDDQTSYTRRLMRHIKLLNAKIAEEGAELSKAETRNHIIAETADVLYFAAVKLAQQKIGWTDVMQELDMRARKIIRRGGDTKVGV